jgi:hypothetical protein
MTQGSGGAAGRREGRGTGCHLFDLPLPRTALGLGDDSTALCVEFRRGVRVSSCVPPRARPCLQASSAYKHSLKEVLTLPAIASKIKDTKAAREVQALQVRMPPAVCRGRGLLLRCMQCTAPVVPLYCPCTAQRMRTALH